MKTTGEVLGDTAIVGCGNCIHWNSLWDAKHGKGKSTCKRIDGDIIQFYKPTFLISAPPTHFPCSEFSPNPMYKQLYANWRGFDEYINNYMTYWDPTLPRRYHTTANTCFTVNHDYDVIYDMRLADYVEGNMWRADGKFNVHTKTYYKRSRRSPTGYQLIHEDIDGLCV